MVEAKSAFNIGLVESNLATSIGLAVFFPMTVLATYLYGNFSLRTV
jgi:MFS family permease